MGRGIPRSGRAAARAVAAGPARAPGPGLRRLVAPRGLAVGLADETRRSRGVLGWIDSSRAGRVVLAYGAAAVMVLAILISLSRGGAVSLGAGALVFLLLRITASARRPSGLRVLLAL